MVVESVKSLIAQFTYNSWISELCGSSEDIMLFGDRIDVDYPNKQQLTVKFGQLINMNRDKDEWFTTCYPTLKLVVPTSVANYVELNSVDERSNTALVSIESIAQANLYVQRLSLSGYSWRSNVQIVYYLQLPEIINLSD